MNLLKKSVGVVFLLLTMGVVRAETLVLWDNDNVLGTDLIAAVDTVHANVSSSDLTQAVSSAAGWANSLGTAASVLGGDLTAAITLGDYYSFIITPDAGMSVTCTNLFVRFAVNDGGGDAADITFHLFASQTGFTAGDMLASYDVLNNDGSYTPQDYPHTFDLSAAGLSAIASAVEFRIYISGTGGNRAGIGHAFGADGADDLILSGTVDPLVKVGLYIITSP